MATANKLSVIPCGAMHANLPFLLLKPGVSIKPRSQKDDKIDWVEVPTHCVLVETDEGRLLWDTSCPSDWEERWGPTGLQEFFPYDAVADDEYLDQQLHKMGIGLDEIDYVVLSHLHFDHAGNANMFKNTNAKMLCSDKEKDFAMNFEGDFQGAHLPDSGTMIFTSDAVYMGESYGPPAAPAAIVNNLEDWFASVEKLRGIQEKTNATMVFGHDNEQIKQLRKAPEASYT
jgi:N-acyl homoserine lactone hydrolase